MSLETGTFISDLVVANPPNTDQKAQGAGHLRLLKSTVKTTFPGITGAVTSTHTELNFVAGVTSGLQSQIDLKAPLASPALTGVPTAPTATGGTNTTQIASTAFVGAALTTFAPLASPALTGIPTAPTAAVGVGTTQLATTAFVAATAFVNTLPGQAGNAGKFLTTDGTNASFVAIPPATGSTLFLASNFGAF